MQAYSYRKSNAFAPVMISAIPNDCCWIQVLIDSFANWESPYGFVTLEGENGEAMSMRENAYFLEHEKGIHVFNSYDDGRVLVLALRSEKAWTSSSVSSLMRSETGVKLTLWICCCRCSFKSSESTNPILS